MVTSCRCAGVPKRFPSPWRLKLCAEHRTSRSQTKKKLETKFPTSSQSGYARFYLLRAPASKASTRPPRFSLIPPRLLRALPGYTIPARLLLLRKLRIIPRATKITYEVYYTYMHPFDLYVYQLLARNLLPTTNTLANTYDTS